MFFRPYLTLETIFVFWSINKSFEAEKRLQGFTGGIYESVQSIKSKKGGYSMKDELLTIKEFAARAGISRQAVYQKLDGKLSDYVVIVNGKKMLDKRALAIENTNKIIDEAYADTCKPVKQENDKKNSQDNQVEIEWLKAELDKKDKLLKRLEEKIDKKDAEITKLNDALIDALDKAHKLTDQQQQLQQLMQTRLLDVPPVEAAATHEPEPEPEPESEQPVKRKGFFSKLFG